MSSAKSAKPWDFRREDTFATLRDACSITMQISLKAGYWGRRVLGFLQIVEHICAMAASKLKQIFIGDIKRKVEKLLLFPEK